MDCVANRLTISLGTSLLVCGITLTFLVLNRSMKPLGNHQNPLLFNLLLHLAINVGYGLKDTIWMYLHCNPGSTSWKTKWQCSLVRMQRYDPPIRSNEPWVQSCSKMSSLLLQLSIQNWHKSQQLWWYIFLIYITFFVHILPALLHKACFALYNVCFIFGYCLKFDWIWFWFDRSSNRYDCSKLAR